jgi:hypothetical protein
MWSDINSGVQKYTLVDDRQVEIKKPDVELIRRVSPVFRWSERDDLVLALRNPTRP